MEANLRAESTVIAGTRATVPEVAIETKANRGHSGFMVFLAMMTLVLGWAVVATVREVRADGRRIPTAVVRRDPRG